MIINADDFGCGPEINRAIIGSISKNLCSSTTIMANMPGFEEACQMVHEHKLLDHTGIHLVLTEGTPLTGGIRKCSHFCNSDGLFNMSRDVRFLRLDNDVKSTVASELRAQIAKCREYGITITHADSHRHAHEEWGIASIVIDVCREEGIPFLRLARNCGQGSTLAKRMYRHLLNRKIRNAGLARTDYFGSARDVLFLFEKNRLSRVRDSVEVMIHPAYNSKGLLVDMIDGDDLADSISRLWNGSAARSFSGHRRQQSVNS